MNRAAQLLLAERVRRAIARGELRRAESCARCGQEGRVYACHVRIDILAPEWLCKSCHGEVCPVLDVSAPPREAPRVIAAEPLMAPSVEDEGTTILERAVRLGQKRQRTKDSYLVSVRSFLKHAGRDPRGWSGASVEAWRDSLRRGGLTPRSTNTRLGGLKYASKRCQQLGWGDDFARGAERLSAPGEKTRRAVPVNVAARLLAVCDDNTPRGLRDQAMILLGFRAGVRREGIVTMNFDDIGPGRRLRIILKGGARHEIPAVDDEVLGALRAWMLWLGDQGISDGPLFRKLRETAEGDWVVSERHLCPEALNFIVRRRVEQAGLEGANVHPHIMRHSFISWQVAAGVPDRRIMAVTGQRDPATLSGYTTDIKADEDPIGNHIPSLVRRRSG